ncbi:hypothetical protein MDAP_001992, partial [Mitosporidium daphniae]
MNEGSHDREIELAIFYLLVLLRYYDKAMEYVSLYTSVSFRLSELELVILRNILEIKYRDLYYHVIQTWTNNLLNENEILFKLSLNDEDKVKIINEIANFIPVISFNFRGSSKIQPDIPTLKEAIKDADSEHSYYAPLELKLTHCCLSFLYHLAGSSKGLPDFFDKIDSPYLNFIRFYLEMEKNREKYKFVSLFHVLFVVFNTSSDLKKLSTFFSDLKEKRVPYDMFDIYQSLMGFQLFSPYDELKRIDETLRSPPHEYENLLSISTKRKALSSDFFKADVKFTFFSDSDSLKETLKSMVFTDELLSRFPIRALKYPMLLGQILLFGSIEELWTFFTLGDQNIHELLDILWSHFIKFFYFWVWKREAFTQKEGYLPKEPLVVTVQDKVFILIEFFTGSLLYEEQKTIMSKIVDKMTHGRFYVVQQGMAGGKPARFGPVAEILATSILRKLPIFIFPNSILNQNIIQLQRWLFNFFGKRVFEFKTERSAYGYSEPYLRNLYCDLTMAHHRGDEGTAFSKPSNDDKKELSSKEEFFHILYRPITRLPCKDQLKRDHKERALLPWQAFLSGVFKSFYCPAYSAANSIPNWDSIINLNNQKSIDQLKWIFFLKESQSTFFRNFEISLIPSVINNPALDSETVVQSIQEQQFVQEQEEIYENLEDPNVPISQRYASFGISDAKLPNLRARFINEFAKTVVDALNLNDSYTKYSVFATMNDVSENLGDASHFFFFPALVNIYNLDEFDLEEMLHYLAYSG